MSAKAGDEAKHTGDLRCRRCGELLHVEEGVTIPRCAVCNGGDFTLRDRPVPKS